MMRNYSKTIGALAAASTFVAGSAMAGSSNAGVAAQTGLQGEVHVGYSSDYIWRGTDLGSGLTEAGVDLKGQVAGLNLSGGLWYGSVSDSAFYNAVLPGINVPDHYDELDIYGEVSKDLGFATVHAGYIYYTYPNSKVKGVPAIAALGSNLIDNAQEAYFGINRELFWGIDGSLTYYWDVEGDNEGYTEARLSKSVKFNDCWSADFGVNSGYLLEQGQLAHITATAAVNYNFTEHAKISPYIAQAWELDGAHYVQGYKYSYGPGNGSPHNYLYGGVKLTVSF